jgi:guanylate kinase
MVALTLIISKINLGSCQVLTLVKSTTILQKSMNQKFIIISGSSGSGKTSVFQFLLDNVSNYNYPQRYTTRAEKGGEVTTETKAVSNAKFLELIKMKKMLCYWERMLNGVLYYYGFNSPDHLNKKSILSANNAFVRELKLNKIDGIKATDCYILFVDALESVRRDRVLLRTPEMHPTELEERMKDNGEDIKQLSDLVIENNTQNKEEFKRLVLNTFINLY